MVASVYPTLAAYYRVPGHRHQGEELLTAIEDYKTKHGEYPSQQWFKGLGDKRVTSEGRLWVYFSPPQHTPQDKVVLIATRIDYGDAYYAGYLGGTIAGTTLETITEE